MKPWHFIVILSIVVIAYFIGRNTKQVEPVEDKTEHIRDSIRDFYANQYNYIDSVNSRQINSLKRRYGIIIKRDTIIKHITSDSERLDSVYSNYQRL